ncbi:MAG: peptide chain release factor N(5)-glutamine methyltransferase [Gammaproteobacteria bacterium]
MNVKSVLRDLHGLDLLDLQVLLAHILKVSRADLYAFDDRELTETEYNSWMVLLARRLAGEPVAYLVGEKECFGMSFIVTPDVLIPRPDTECLIESSLRAGGPECRGETSFDRFTILDLGTGSGVIACVLASHIPDSNILATDISPAALAIAEKNVARHGLKNVTLRASDGFKNIPETFDLIVSNPPYLAKNDLHLSGEIRFEPIGALVADDDGFAMLRRIIEGAVTHLNPGGCICLEHGFEQGPGVRGLFNEYGFNDITTVNDLSGHERVTTARK